MVTWMVMIIIFHKNVFIIFMGFTVFWTRLAASYAATNTVATIASVTTTTRIAITITIDGDK
jgi:hypothetical protein